MIRTPEVTFWLKHPKSLSPPQASLCGDNYFWRFNHTIIELKRILEREEVDMSRDTEKAFKAMNEFLQKNATEDMSNEAMNDLIQGFMEEYNSNRPEEVTEKTAKTSDDFVELAEGAEKSIEPLFPFSIIKRSASKLSGSSFNAFLA